MKQDYLLVGVPEIKFDRFDQVLLKDKIYTVLDIHYCLEIDEFAYYLHDVESGETTTVAVEIVDGIAVGK